MHDRSIDPIRFTILFNHLRCCHTRIEMEDVLVQVAVIACKWDCVSCPCRSCERDKITDITALVIHLLRWIVNDLKAQPRICRTMTSQDEVNPAMPLNNLLEWGPHKFGIIAVE